MKRLDFEKDEALDVPARLVDVMLVAVKHELDEAKSEIARHHRDFERIREDLDGYERALDVDSGSVAATVLRSIRSIVG